MRAYQNGSEPAFQMLFERHSGRVYGFILKKLKNKAHADDVFQNTFLKFHQTRSHYDPSFPFVPWLFTVCKSVMIDYLRKMKRIKEEELDFDPSEDPREAAAALDAVLIEKLSEQQRHVINLRFQEDLNFTEIARRLETSPSNVRQILSRGIRRLRGAKQ